MSLSLCALVWCLFSTGNPTGNPISISGAVDVYRPDDARERLVLVEARRAFVGLVAGQRLAMVAGVVPLRFSIGRLVLEGGALVATSPVPPRGTHANWVARASIRMSDHWTVGWLHVSNAQTGGHNPALDALSVSWSF